MGNMCSEVPQPLPQSCKLSRILLVPAHVFLHSLDDLQNGLAFNQPACRSAHILSVLTVWSAPYKPESALDSSACFHTCMTELLQQRNTD